jgi:WW domain-binding protein 4
MSDYSTPESLGYTDPDIERARAEAERRRTQGVAGDWEVVVPATTEPPPGAGEDPIQHGDDVQNRGDNQEGGKKRAVPDTAEEDEGRWKLRKKTTTVGLGDIYDPGIIAVKLRAKAEVKEDETASTTTQPPGDAPEAGDAKATALPKWAPVKWKRAGEPADDTSGEGTPRLADGETVPTEGVVLPDPQDAVEMPAPAPVADVLVKGEPSIVKLGETTASGEAPSSGGSLFRKRKAPAGGGASSRGRRF